MSSPILVFDIETIPDLPTGRCLYDIDEGVGDEDALQALIAARQEESGSDFMRLPLHQVACLSFLWVENGVFSLKSLSLQNMSEYEILSTFLRAFHRKPTLVSWNGAGFDLPVLLYRMAHYQMNAKPLAVAGQRYEDYLDRYSKKHIDLIDKFSFGLYNNKQKLNVIAALCGYAGKGDVDGSQVVPMVQAGQWDKLTTYCESDVLNTWLLYLRYQLLIGAMTDEMVNDTIAATKAFLQTVTNDDGVLRHENFLE